MDEEPPPEAAATFQRARSAVAAASAARTALAEQWSELCDSDAFDWYVVPTSAATGRLEVAVYWPPAVARKADEVARSFATSIKAALDLSLFAAAAAVSGAIISPSPDDYVMPICEDEESLLAMIDAGVLQGLRPDQIQTVWSLQPTVLESQPERASALDLSIALRQLKHLLSSDASHRPVAVWAHSATPLFDFAGSDATVTPTPSEDGVLETVLEVCTLACHRVGVEEVRVNPMIAFDLISNAPPYPRDPDDNFMRRSALLLALAQRFVDGLERSIAQVRTREAPFGSLAPLIEGSLWGRIDDAATDRDRIEQALSASDLGIATRFDSDGTVTVLLNVGDEIFARPVPPALPLDPTDDPGPAAEVASLHAAAFWGLPDFVFNPSTVRKGGAQREVGDCTVIAGQRALAVQVKHRAPQANTPTEIEVGRVSSRISTGADQAAGSIRSLDAATVGLVNARGRVIPVTGADLEWCRVVIVDHPSPPAMTVQASDHGPIPLVVLLRRDWDFLFDHLRSTTAVVNYLFRVSSEATHVLGEEAARYFELARADEVTPAGGATTWVSALGATPISTPLLPTAPASSGDDAGATVYRLIMEDIAVTAIENSESERLALLSLLDRYPVAKRAELGRLLLTHLDDVVSADGAIWRFRRTVLDNGALQLSFGACTAFSQIHREAFGQWAMIRHHELCEGYQPMKTDRTPVTVAVLLTPRHDGSARLWDTTSYTLFGDLQLSDVELNSMRALWSNPEASGT